MYSVRRVDEADKMTRGLYILIKYTSPRQRRVTLYFIIAIRTYLLLLLFVLLLLLFYYYYTTANIFERQRYDQDPGDFVPADSTAMLS